MPTIEMGAEPWPLLVRLTRAADFVQAIESTDAAGTAVNWLDGETLKLTFSTGDVWAATFATNVASWNVDKAVVGTLADAKPRSAELVYTDGAGFDAVWGRGTVKVG